MKSELLKENLIGLAVNGGLSHAYILESHDKINLNMFAQNLAKGITPYSEDVHNVYADGISVKDKAIEALLARIQLKPMAGDRNIAIIGDADTMTHRAQNRLLKTLEEPPGKALILLLSNNAENLLPTIRSRCVLFRPEFPQIQAEVYRDKEAVEGYGYLIGKAIIDGRRYYSIIDMLKEVTIEREYAYVFLDEMEEWFRSILISGLGIPGEGEPNEWQLPAKLPSNERVYKSIALIEAARRDLNRRINTGYAIKNMILQMI